MPESSITIRAVDRFEEPAFTALVNEVLHDPDRRRISELYFGPSGPPPAKSGAQQVRVGAFAGEALVGWCHAWLQPGGTLYAANSGVVAAYRRLGVYTQLVAAVEQQALALGCLRIQSHHRAANNAVLIAKMKAGYTIVGTESTLEMGLLLKMGKELDPRRAEVFRARAGTLEETARFFDPSAR
ncbi:MAG: GNAT family N-acetyltransferase [Ramlibacter sp.]